jgi:hypothetical protein
VGGVVLGDGVFAGLFKGLTLGGAADLTCGHWGSLGE